MEDMKRFGEKVTRLLDARGMAQVQAAKAIGVDASQFGKWLQGGRYKPSIEQLFSLSKVLGVPMNFLADDTLDEPQSGEPADVRNRALWELAKLVGPSELFAPVGSESWEPHQYQDYLFRLRVRYYDLLMKNTVESIAGLGRISPEEAVKMMEEVRGDGLIELARLPGEKAITDEAKVQDLTPDPPQEARPKRKG